MKNRLDPRLIVLSIVFVVTVSCFTVEAQRAGGPGGRGRMNPAGMIAAAMLSQGDLDGNAQLNREEFVKLGRAWFRKLSADGEAVSSEAVGQGFGGLLNSESPGGGGVGRFLGGVFSTAVDGDKDGTVTAAEFGRSFEKWFTNWDADQSGSLDQAKLNAGVAAAMPRPRRRGGFGPRTPDPDDATGFTAIFDGKTLAGWDGDPRFWRAENGELIGQSTEDNPVDQNTFLIWQGGKTKNFEFKVEYRISDGANSGVQYRSSILSERGQWAMRGYQADMDSANRFTGMIYEERGRGFLAPRGQFARILGGRQAKLIGTLGESDALGAFIKADDWNQLHIVARDNVIIQSVNGHVMSALVDDDVEGRASEGLLGLQIHTGPPMKLQFRNLLFKDLQ